MLTRRRNGVLVPVTLALSGSEKRYQQDTQNPALFIAQRFVLYFLTSTPWLFLILMAIRFFV
jgi:hypothetical protein